MVRDGARFADAAAEYLRYSEQDRGCRPATLRDYRSNLTGVITRSPTSIVAAI